MKFWNFRRLLFISIIAIVFTSCEHELEYIHDKPVDFISWMDDVDTIFCDGDIKIDGKSDRVLGRSNFEMLGLDTQFSFIIKIPKTSNLNPKGINFLGFKLTNLRINQKLDSNSFDNKILQLSTLQFNSGETKIIPTNFVISSLNENYFEFNGTIKVIYSSVFSSLDSFTMEFNKLKIEKSFVRVWVKGNQISPINWDIDLKSGNEYFPEPTIAIIPDFGKTIQIGVALSRNKFYYPIGNGEKQYTRLKVGSNKYFLPSGGGLKFTQFSYKDKLKCIFSTNYIDSSNASNNYLVDSIKINYSRISF